MYIDKYRRNPQIKYSSVTLSWATTPFQKKKNPNYELGHIYIQVHSKDWISFLEGEVDASKLRSFLSLNYENSFVYFTIVHSKSIITQ